MPMIQLDLQPLDDAQRAELRPRVVAAVCRAIGSPYPYISVIIREHEPANLIEAGGWGPYDSREDIPEAYQQPVPDNDASVTGERAS